MPIKFRCQHCRQFLGISRERAGDIFDCPTCGRTLRVPELDGTVKPLPRVKLDLADSELRKALDELADLSSNPSEGDAIEFDAIDDAGRSTQPKPDLKPQIIPAVVQPPPKPIELAPVVPVIRDQQEHAGRKTQEAVQNWKAIVELAEGDSSESLVAESEPERHDSAPNKRPKADSSTRAARGKSVELNASFWFATIGVSAAVFTAGFWAGRLTVSVPATVVEKQPKEESRVVPAKAEPETKSTTASIKGRITFRPEAGANRPDRGARVVALPLDWAGKAKLQAVGFRSADNDGDQRIARASLQAMGGDLAVTDESGEYSLQLQSGGQFLLVVLSGSMPRPEMDDTQAVLQQLSPYFDRPLQLIGKVMIHVERISWSGENAQPWDHVFQRG